MPTAISQRRRGLFGTAGDKTPCIAASTANLTLSGEQTVDGISLVEVSSDRCLVKDQTTASENGIYVVATGTWQRAEDWDGRDDVVEGTMVGVNRGTANADTYWKITTTGTITIGTTSVTIARTNFHVYSEVNTMSALLTASTSNGVVIMLGFHTKGDGGGGEFFWDSSANKNTHNGGTIIDPTNAADLATWDASAKTTWFTAGSGTGCWKRVDPRIIANSFGAKGDGTEDDASAWRQTVASLPSIGGTAFGIPGNTYLMEADQPDPYQGGTNATVVIKDKDNIHIDLTGCIIKQTGLTSSPDSSIASILCQVSYISRP